VAEASLSRYLVGLRIRHKTRGSNALLWWRSSPTAAKTPESPVGAGRSLDRRHFLLVQGFWWGILDSEYRYHVKICTGDWYPGDQRLASPATPYSAVQWRSALYHSSAPLHPSKVSKCSFREETLRLKGCPVRYDAAVCGTSRPLAQEAVISQATERSSKQWPCH